MNGNQGIKEQETAYIYVITRSDLSIPQMSVQSGHALIEAIRRFAPGQNEEHPHLVYCVVSDEVSLTMLALRLESKDVKFSCFHEIDLNNALTAIATAPLRGNERSCLRGLSLMKGTCNE